MNKFYFHKTENGYIFDKRFFWGIIVLLLLIFVYIGFLYEWDFRYKFHIVCTDPVCDNPMTDPSVMIKDNLGRNLKSDCEGEFCEKKLLETGEYGEESPFLVNNFTAIGISLIILSLILNHFVHNRGKAFQIKLNLPDKWIKKIKEAYKNDSED